LYKRRIEKLRQLMSEKKLDAVFINSYENFRYFSGFTGTNAFLLITYDAAIFITDQRYTTQAEEQTDSYEVITYGTDQFGVFKEQFNRFNIKTVGVESLSMSLQLFQQLQSHLPSYTWEYLEKELLYIRKIKDEHEIEILREAIAISDKAFADLIPVIRPGMTEKELKIEFESIMMRLGSEKPAFATGIASDVRAALPHATPTDNEIKKNDLLLIDYGVTYKGYVSDMTRTLWVGEPSKEMQEYYDLVMISLEESIAAIKPGISGHDLDAVSRKVFLDAGVEEYSLRGLGHGIGLQVHENPRVAMYDYEVLEENMILTIEPGLYFPGKGGIRIEDMVLVTKDGCEVLNKTNRHIQLSILT